MAIETGIIGVAILALDIWAILKTMASEAETGNKTLWVVLILVLPVLGLILWAIAGPKARQQT